ncbi:MAG: hypothetical protein AB7E32_02185 [Desulfovibrio sp.]
MADEKSLGARRWCDVDEDAQRNRSLAFPLGGHVVDRVNEVADIPGEHIFPPPSMGVGKGSHCVQGMGKVFEQVKLQLNVPMLLGEEELEALA